MIRRNGRAYLFIRWSGPTIGSTRLGDVAWAFENIDRQGRFYCFQCGATEVSGSTGLRPRSSWSEKCFSLPELIKAMSNISPDRPGYDEVKVFEVQDADPDSALVAAQRLAEDVSNPDPLNDTREILLRYGVRGLVPSRGFSAPFLWYNILPGRSVPLRKLAVHLFEVSAATAEEAPLTPEEVEDQSRKVAHSVSDVRDLGECFVTRIRSGFLVALNIAVDPHLSVASGRDIADRVDQAVRGVNTKIRHVFVLVQPYEPLP
jgi:hypothetical protein